MPTATLENWQRIVDAPRLQNGYLEFKFTGVHKSTFRGLIKAMKIVENSQGSYKYKVLKIDLLWLARRRNDDDPWVIAEKGYALTYEIPCEYRDITRDGICLNLGSYGYDEYRLLPVEYSLDRSSVMTGYHVEVQVKHSLYPPSPCEMERFGIAYNVEPRHPKTQDEVKVAAIVFVVPAFSLKEAKAWCQAECDKFQLPVLGMKKTHLVPGF